MKGRKKKIHGNHSRKNNCCYPDIKREYQLVFNLFSLN